MIKKTKILFKLLPINGIIQLYFSKKGSLRPHLDNTFFFYFSFGGLTIFQVLKGKPLPTFLETFLK